MSDKPVLVALITGSGRDRVGNVIAKGLAADGYRIALHYHSSKKSALESRDELRSSGTTCEAFQANVSEEQDVQAMVDQVVAAFGRIDVLVTTSSIWPTETLEETTAASVLKSFEVNTLGTFNVAKAAGLVMVGQETGGSIVTMGDWKIDRPYLDHSAYLIAKGAIPTLTKTMALELGHRNPNVRVNCIHPGPVMFPPGTSESERQQLIDSTLSKTANQPEAVTAAVRFFIQNAMVTGTSLPVDGGQHMFSPETSQRNRH
ncbi:MAG: SDR family oxidoreductase [Fuerstiella sp.]